MHAAWLRPTSTISAQRLADQWRSLKQSNFFTDVELEAIARVEQEETRGAENGVDESLTALPDQDSQGRRDRIADQDVHESVAVNAHEIVDVDQDVDQDSHLCRGRIADHDRRRSASRDSADLDRMRDNSLHDDPTDMSWDVPDADSELFVSLHQVFTRHSGAPMDSRERLPVPRGIGWGRLSGVVHRVNGALSHLLSLLRDRGHPLSLECLNNATFSAAVLVLQQLNVRFPGNEADHRKRNRPPGSLPGWQVRIEKRIHHLRQDVSRLTSYLNMHPQPGPVACTSRIHRIYGIRSQHEATLLLEVQKMELVATAARFRAYKTSQARRVDNTLFQTDQRAFYRRLQSQTRPDTGVLPPLSLMVTCQHLSQ